MFNQRKTWYPGVIHSIFCSTQNERQRNPEETIIQTREMNFNVKRTEFTLNKT